MKEKIKNVIIWIILIFLGYSLYLIAKYEVENSNLLFVDTSGSLQSDIAPDHAGDNSENQSQKEKQNFEKESFSYAENDELDEDDDDDADEEDKLHALYLNDEKPDIKGEYLMNEFFTDEEGRVSAEQIFKLLSQSVAGVFVREPGSNNYIETSQYSAVCISPEGYFLSSYSALAEVLDRKGNVKTGFGLALVMPGSQELITVKVRAYDTESDILILEPSEPLKIEETEFKALKLIKNRLPEPGEKVYVLNAPVMVHEKGGISECTVHCVKAELVSENGRKIALFELDSRLAHNVGGGPVFDKYGRPAGFISSAYSGNNTLFQSINSLIDNLQKLNCDFISSWPLSAYADVFDMSTAGSGEQITPGAGDGDGPDESVKKKRAESLAKHSGISLGLWFLSDSDYRYHRRVFNTEPGVSVESVRPASPAYLANIKSGDVIVLFDRKPVYSTDDILRILLDKAGNNDMIEVRVSRLGGEMETLRIYPERAAKRDF